MRKTKEILTQFKNLIRDGKINPEDVPIDDIKACVLSEINMYKNTYTDHQYSELTDCYNGFCENISDGDTDTEKVMLFINGMLISMLTISETASSLINREYWTYKHENDVCSPEITSIIDYIDRTHEVRLLNYDFVDNYRPDMYKTYYDDVYNQLFIPYKGRKMYFPEGWDTNKALDYFCSVVSEQDKQSPHCYRKEGYEVMNDSIIIDAGAAEGLFSLDYIDIAKKIYIIDADIEWIKALRKTFSNDYDKVEIIHGYIGDATQGSGTISIDSLVGDTMVNYIKMDIEGYEKAALNGAEKTLENNENITCAICSYHNSGDELWIKEYFNKIGFDTDNSEGYMFPDWETGSVLSTELRRGIVFGKKKRV